MVHSTPEIEAPWTGHRLRAPRTDFALLCEPPLPAAVETAQQNHAALTQLDVKLQGRTVSQMRKWTREEALRAARDYTSRILAASASPNCPLEASSDDSAVLDLLFVAGHQPALFHPGVWVKNFAIHEMATRTGGISLNLSVDTDVMGSTRIRVPTGQRSALKIERVPFDTDRPAARGKKTRFWIASCSRASNAGSAICWRRGGSRRSVANTGPRPFAHRRRFREFATA